MYKDIIEVDFTNEFDQVISPGTEVIYFTTNVIWPRRGTYIGTKPPSATDWARLQAMTDDDIDFSDDPERDAQFLAQGPGSCGKRQKQTMYVKL